MPVIEGLLPVEDDRTVADMLFELANWHALAKLRMQHDVTLANLEHATTHMYAAIRRFAETTCAAHTAYELPSDTDARTRRARTKPGGVKPGEGARRVVKFNVMNTFKYYNLGNYVDYIRRSGPTDNYSTQIVRNRMTSPKRISDKNTGRVGASACQTRLRSYQQSQLRAANRAAPAEAQHGRRMARAR